MMKMKNAGLKTESQDATARRATSRTKKENAYVCSYYNNSTEPLVLTGALQQNKYSICFVPIAVLYSAPFSKSLVFFFFPNATINE